jgi:hypothetical protein
MWCVTKLSTFKICNVGGRLMNEYGAVVEWYWQGKTRVMWEKLQHRQFLKTPGFSATVHMLDQEVPPARRQCQLLHIRDNLRTDGTVLWLTEQLMDNRDTCTSVCGQTRRSALQTSVHSIGAAGGHMAGIWTHLAALSLFGASSRESIAGSSDCESGFTGTTWC